MSDQAPQSRKKTDWHDVRQKTISGVIVTIIIALLGGIGTLIWNTASQGGLVRALGGVTQSELESTIKKLTLEGPPGPAGPVGLGTKDLSTAVIAFDSQCPPGWSLMKEAVGSAIVGVGATALGETGSPLTAPVQTATKRGKSNYSPDTVLNIVPPKGISDGWVDVGTYDWEPISRYVKNVRTNVTPTYYPLTYCKQVTGSSYDTSFPKK